MDTQDTLLSRTTPFSQLQQTSLLPCAGVPFGGVEWDSVTEGALMIGFLLALRALQSWGVLKVSYGSFQSVLGVPNLGIKTRSVVVVEAGSCR